MINLKQEERVFMNRSDLDAVKYRAQLAKYIRTSGRATWTYAAAKRRERYLEEKKERDSQPRSVMITSTNKLCQEFSSTEARVKKEVRADLQLLRKNIVDFVKDNIDFTKRIENGYSYHRDVDFAQMEEIIKILLPILKEFKTECDGKMLAPRKGEYTEYEKLFNELISIDARFILFAPYSCIKAATQNTTTKTKIQRLPDCYKEELKNRKNKLKADRTADYVTETNVGAVDASDERVGVVTEMCQFIENSKNAACDEMIVALWKLHDGVYNYLRGVYGIEIDGSTPLTLAQIEDIVTVICSSPLRNLKRVSAHRPLREYAGWKSNDPYTALFNNLVKVDIKFAIYAPITTLKSSKLDFKKLTEEEKDLVFARFQECGLWNNEKYVEIYHSVFAGQVAKMSIDTTDSVD